MLRHITRLITGLLAAGLLLALAPSASATTTYDITQVGDADWVSVTSNGRELSGQTTASDGLQVTATVRLRIDDIGALREGDTVLVKATAASGSHFGPNLFSRTTLPPSLLDRQGNGIGLLLLRPGRDEQTVEVDARIEVVHMEDRQVIHIHVCKPATGQHAVHVEQHRGLGSEGEGEQCRGQPMVPQLQHDGLHCKRFGRIRF